MANERVTKAGVYVEEGGANLHDTKTGVYVELQLPTAIEDQVTKAGVYVELTNTMDRVTQAGVYVELQPTERVTQVGAYVELRGTLQATKTGVYVEIAPPQPNPPTLASLADFTATLTAFDFLPIVNPPFIMRPIRWSWQDLGVSNEAEIAVEGQLNSIINWLPELPRMPVSIYNPIKTDVWSGFVNGIEVQIDDLILSITLDGLANRVIVAYNELAEGSTTATAAYTTPATDGESVARYGYHELLYVYGDASADQAEALRDRIVADLAAIQSETRFDEGQGVSARLLCKGWIHSAGWRVFDESSTTNATIADQVGQVASLMECINVIDIKDDNTIESNPYTEPVNAYDKLAALLAIADQDGDTRRMVIPQIGVFRYEKVYRSEDQYIFSNNRFYRANGYPLQPGEFILGYCRDIGKRMIGQLANANRFYVEESEYEAASGQYTIRTRGTPSPWR
jgi:hypothetical protein